MTMQMVALGDLFQIGSSKRVLKSQWKTEGVPFYRGREVTRLAVDGIVDNELFISEEHFAELAGQYGVPKAGDIVITAIGTIGNSHIVRESDRFYFKDASVLWMKRATNVSSEFVNLWLKSPLFFDQLDKGNGATVDTLTIQKLQSVRLSLPPLPEQQRIVGILDEALDGIATAKANAEKNLQNARALFESHLQSVFTQRGEGWVEKTLGTLATFRNGINYTKDSKGERVKIVGVKDFKNSFWVTLDNLDTVTIDGELNGLDELKRGDILAVRSNGNLELIGRTILAGEVPEKISHSGFTIRIRLSNRDVLPQYLCHFMKCAASRKQFVEGGTGTNIKSLNQQTLSALGIPFPPFAEQKALIAKLESLSAETQCLESLYQQKLAALDALKKSLLHQAYTGAL